MVLPIAKEVELLKYHLLAGCLNTVTSICRKNRGAPLQKRVGKVLLFAALILLSSVATLAQATLEKPTSPTAERDGQHDFDFEIGTWKTHLKRLAHPLSGSNQWIECSGISVIRKVWDGRANLLELEAECPSGHLQALSLRLYNPQSRQWSLNFSNSSGGTLSQPTIGEFKNGLGQFYDQETFRDRAILVRFVISDITPNSCRFAQSFSDDGGKTWEVNWIAVDTRVTDASDSAH